MTTTRFYKVEEMLARNWQQRMVHYGREALRRVHRRLTVSMSSVTDPVTADCKISFRHSDPNPQS